jgi:YD repeat-containing protein
MSTRVEAMRPDVNEVPVTGGAALRAHFPELATGRTATSCERRRALGRVLLATLSVCVLARPTLAQQPEATPAETGFARLGNYPTFEPYEHLDTQTLRVVLRFSDLTLPGHRGRNLRIERTLIENRWFWGIAGVPTTVRAGNYAGYAAWGIGVEAPKDAILNSGPELIFDDASQRRMYYEQWPNPDPVVDPVLGIDPSYQYSISTDLMRYDAATKTVYMPDGSWCEYGQPGPFPNQSVLTLCADAFGPFLTVSYGAGTRTIRQILEGTAANPTQYREVVFSTSTGGSTTTTQMQYLNRTWTLTHNSVQTTFDEPGVSTPWTFYYELQSPTTTPYGMPEGAIGLRLLTHMFTPAGAHVEYTYQDHHRLVYSPPDPEPDPIFRGWFLASRQTSGTVSAPGVWTFHNLQFNDATPNTPEVFSLTAPSAGAGSATTIYGNVAAHMTHELTGDGWMIGATSITTSRQTPTRRLHAWPVPVQLVYYPADTMFPASWGDFRLTTLVPGLTTEYVCDGPSVSSNCVTYEREHVEIDDYHNPARTVERSSSMPGAERITVNSYRNQADPAGLYVLGLPESTTVSVGADLTTTFNFYDANTGFKTKTISAGVTTAFEPDAHGNVETKTVAFDTTDARSETYAYDWGVMKTAVTAAGTTQRQINSDGKVTSETTGYGTARARTSTFTYDAFGRLETETPSGGVLTRTDYDLATQRWVKQTRGTAITETTLDGFGRPILVKSGAVSEGYQNQIRTDYYPDGRVKKAWLPVAAGATTGPFTEFVYDDVQAILTEIPPHQAARTHARQIDMAAGNAVREVVTDEESRATTIIRRGFGVNDAPVTRLTDAASQVWDYSYDRITSALTQVQGPGGVTRTWMYEPGTKRLQLETHPESGTVTYQYRSTDGLLISKQDARQTAFAYEYLAGRLSAVTRTLEGASGERTEYEYESGSDRIARVTGPDFVTVTTYDAGGRLETRSDTVDGGPTLVATYDYDNRGNLEELTYPSGRVVRYAYDGMDRLARVCRGAVTCDTSTPLASTFAFDFEYHPSGALTQYRAGNGVLTTLDYEDPLQRLSRLTAGAGPTRLELSYGYRPAGNIETITDATRPEWTQTFTYDAVDRLETASSIAYGPLAYTYDAHGNRQTGNGLVYTYDSANPFRLQTIGGGYSFSYDNNGNLTGGFGAGGSYTYGPENQLAISNATGTATRYTYDDQLWRLKKATDGGATIHYARGPQGQLLTEAESGPSAKTRDYIYAGGRLIAAVTTTGSTGGGLPSGWTGNDVGAVGFAGSSVESNGTYTVTASGADIWEYSDQYHFAWRQLTGDGSIVARVATLNAADSWAKAGVMMRESLAGGAKHGFSMLSTGNGLAFQRRVTTDDYTTHSWGSSETAPHWVRLTRVGDSVSGYTSADGVSWTLTDTDTIVMGATIYVGLAVTSHDNTALATATFDGVSVTSGPWTGLPTGWSSEDIGAVGLAGAASHAGGTFTVTASGTDVWHATDEFRYVYRPLVGDGTITARVTTVEFVNNWTKAGVMIRESLAGGSRHAFMLASANRGLAFQRRVTTDDVSTHTAGEQVPAPRWVRLTRVGNTISAYSSVDGVTWTLVDTDTISMGGTVYVGLAVTSHDNAAVATATFTDVTVE